MSDVRTSEAGDATLPELGARLLDDVVVEVSGDDARSWLQGQITCDLGGREAPAATYGLVLGAKGRIVSDLWVYDDGDPERIHVALPAGRGEATPERTLERLERYLVMEDVELERVPLRVLSLQGTAAPGPAAEGGFPAGRLAGGVDRLVPEDAAAAQLGAALAEGFGPLDAVQWERARVRLGRPAFPADAGDMLPQEAGLKSAVSFGKGCYFGQEAVVMLEHRGKPPRRTVQIALPGPLVEAPLAVEAGGREAGTLTSVVPAADDGLVGLARVKRKVLEAGTELRVGDRDVRVLRVLE
ncbi:MAG: hypothetical protein AAGH15_14985 [Myxococcota bacterium]